jgi:hypothetical protein
MIAKCGKVYPVYDAAQSIAASAHQYGFYFGIIQKRLQVKKPAFICVGKIVMAAAYGAAGNHFVSPAFQGLPGKNNPLRRQVPRRTGDAYGVAGLQIGRNNPVFHKRKGNTFSNRKNNFLLHNNYAVTVNYA